jgi:hypothetical protein
MVTSPTGFRNRELKAMLNYAVYELGCIKSNPDTKTTLAHWRKLGNSENHPAIGAGVHQQITATPIYLQEP